MTDQPRGKTPDLQEQLRVMSAFTFTGSRFELRATFFGDGHAEIRHGGTVTTGPDEVAIDFEPPVRGEDAERAAARLRSWLTQAKIAWVRSDGASWRLDGDAVRELLGNPEKLTWLSGWREVPLRLDFQHNLRSGFESEWKASFRLTEKAWRVADQTPWEPRWRIETPNAGGGGQATVDKVVDRDGLPGALKVPRAADQGDSERRFRMFKEVGALQLLNGRGTPRVLDSNVQVAGDKDKKLYCVLEWVDGPTLEKHVRDNGPLSFDDARTVVVRLAETLHRLHAEGYLHRDLHPRNVILRNGSVEDAVLIDFGMTSWEPEQEELGITGRGQELGNRFLRLPEYAPGMHRDDPASDVTQLCGLLLYLMTGQAPRQLVDPEGKKPHERINAKRLAKLKEDSRWSRIFRLLDRAFDLQPTDRIRSVSGLKEVLFTVDEELPPLLDAELRVLRENVMADQRLAEEKRVRDILWAAADVAVATIEDAIYAKGMRVQVKRGDLNSRGYTVDLTFHQNDGQTPLTGGTIELSRTGGAWSGSYRLPMLQSAPIFSTGDEKEIEREMKTLAQRFLTDVARMINLEYAAARDTTHPPLQRNLVFAFPVGLMITSTHGDDRIAVHFRLRNNAARSLADIVLSVAAPSHLDPTTAVATNNEGQWVRCFSKVPSLEMDEGVDLLDLTMSRLHSPDDSLIMSLTTPPYRWTGTIKLASLFAVSA